MGKSNGSIIRATPDCQPLPLTVKTLVKLVTAITNV